MITPDGTRIVYKGGARIDRTQLFVYALDQLEPKPLTDPVCRRVRSPRPTGTGSASSNRARARRGGQEGRDRRWARHSSLETRWPEPRRRLGRRRHDHCRVRRAGRPGLLRISPAGGEPAVLTRPEPRTWEKAIISSRTVLPGSRSVLFTITAFTGGIDAAQVACSMSPRARGGRVIRGASQAQYVSSGHLVYVAGGALWAIAFDPARASTRTGRVVVPQVVTLPTGVAEFDIAGDGTLVYVGEAARVDGAANAGLGRPRGSRKSDRRAAAAVRQRAAVA